MGLAEEIAKLDELRHRGAVSQEEYERIKATLISNPQQAGDGSEGRRSPSERDINMWGLFLHLSQFCGYVVPLAGYVAPIVIWQIKKEDSPTIDAHGRVVVNWLISELIYLAVCIPLLFVGIGFLGLIALAVLGIIFPLVGGIKANDGEVWPYPLSIRFFR